MRSTRYASGPAMPAGTPPGSTPNNDLLPDIFAGPYLYLEPGLSFVLDDEGRAVGYVLGTADTARFVSRYRSEWLPTLAGRYREPVGPPVSPEEQFVVLLYHPERMLLDQLACYPAHLHIDLLPDYQRSGYGRSLIEDVPRRIGTGRGAVAYTSWWPARTRAPRSSTDGLASKSSRYAGPPGSALYFGRVVEQPAT